MSMHLGNVPASSTLYIPFATYGKTNGESITMTGFAVTDIEIYKNGSTTQRSSDNGYVLLDTDGTDFDSITGIHGFSVDLSDNTDAGFYSAGAFYWVIVSAVTVDSQTVNFIAATFRIVKAEGVTGVPKADVDSVAGVAVSTTTAQLGVNVVQISTDATAADNLEAEYDNTGFKSYTRRGTAQAGAAGTITLDSGASATNAYYNNQYVVLISGTGAGQVRRARDYNGGTKVLDVDSNWATNPDSTTVFVLWPNYSANVTSWLNQTVATPLENGVPWVEVRSISGDVTAADNLEAWFDNTGYSASNSTVGTVQVVQSVTGLAVGVITAASIAADAIGASELAADAANEIADAILDRTSGVETSYTLRQSLRLILSACAAKLSGAATTTVTIRDAGDTKARITATVDADGNRTAVTLDAT